MIERHKPIRSIRLLTKMRKWLKSKLFRSSKETEGMWFMLYYKATTALLEAQYLAEQLLR